MIISIVKAKYLDNYRIELHFSDYTYGVLDFSWLLDINTQLTRPLHQQEYFKTFFLDYGALCWKNSLEFSAESLQQRLIQNKALFKEESAA